MNYLGIDFGEKHVGIAVATTFVAEPLEVVPAVTAIDRIKELIIEYKVDGLVLGLSEGLMAEKTKAFGQLLTETFRLPLYFQDETLTSQDTRKEMAKKGVKRSIRQAKTDHYVAAAFLQEFLDSTGI